MSQIQQEFNRRNYALNLVEGMLFVASSAFVSVQIVLPAIVTRLGGGNLAVGALTVILYVGLFLPQVFAARYIETLPWKKPWTLRSGTAQRGAVLLMGIALLLFGGSRPTLALALILLLFTLNNLLGGIATPAWFDLFTKVTPLNRRGRLLGWRTALGGVSALVGGLVLTWLLATFDFPLNYALGLFIAYVLQMASIGTQSLLVEAEPSRTVLRRAVFAYLRRLPVVFRENKDFKNFIVSSAFLIVATMPIGFFTVYALKRFNADESMVGGFTLGMLSMQGVSALVSGFIADKYGHKRSLIIGAVGMMLANVWALIAPTVGWFLIVFMFVGVNIGTELMARYNIAVEYASVEQRSTYVALMNTALAPVYLSGLLGGWVSDLFGYGAVFLFGLLFSAVGLVLLVRQVRDPRSLSLSH